MWNYKPSNAIYADSPGVKISDKILNLKIIVIPLICDLIHGSMVNGMRQPIRFSFVLDKPSGYKPFCEPENIRFKKTNKSVLISITFYLETDKIEEVNFFQEALTFTLKTIKN